ncbi:MAG TPA: hypothetical protein VLT36_11675, partial [Candidatus Dormibacteraeota bacterium]|nr:hypothetical protein [Candidatus Dormibacteraeota bacterium]
MTKLTRLFLYGIFALTSTLCFAQAPQGTITLPFDRSTPLIDLSGTFEPTNQVINGIGGQQVGLSLAFNVIHDATGRLHGNGTTIFSVGSDPATASFFAGTYVANGRVSGGGSAPIKAFLTVHFTGSGTLSGKPTTFTMVITYNLVFNPDDVVLEGTSHGTASFSGFGRSVIKTPVAVPLPGGSDGTWTALLDVVPLQKLGGSGSIVIEPGTISGNRTLQGI